MISGDIIFNHELNHEYNELPVSEFVKYIEATRALTAQMDWEKTKRPVK